MSVRAQAEAPARRQLPAGFVYLRDVAPTIRQDMRYAGPYNFIGRPVRGYEAAECILTAAAARQLGAVQAELAKQNLSLVVWDCYRPRRAVLDFSRWMRSPEAAMAPAFFPRTAKKDLVRRGYIGSRSMHSAGSTVDLGLVPAALEAVPAWDGVVRDCAAPAGQRSADGTVDLGTGFDCFDPRAHFTSSEVGNVARANRALLRRVMTAQGFAPYDREWWHFRLATEPFPGRAFDFSIPPRDQSREAPQR